MTDSKSDNEMIRQFMNVKTRILPNGGFPVEMWYREGDYENFFSPFEYSKEWNHIMPVVAKIYAMAGSFGVFNASEFYSANIEGVYKQVVIEIKAINAYNENKKP